MNKDCSRQDKEVCCEICKAKFTIRRYVCPPGVKSYRGYVYPPGIKSYELCNQCQNSLFSKNLSPSEYCEGLNGCELCGRNRPATELSFSSGIVAMCLDKDNCDKRIKEHGLLSICSLCKKMYLRIGKEHRFMICDNCVA